MSAAHGTVPAGVVPMVQRPGGVLEPLPLTVLRPGQTPVRQGSPCAAVWIVETGLLRAVHVADDGRALLVDVVGAGEVVGEPADVPAPWDVVAVRPSRLRTAPGPTRDALLAARSHRLVALASDLAWRDVPTRIERRLADLAERFGRPVPGGTAVPFRLTQDDIASLAGTTRESANRAIRGLVARGIVRVEGRGRYVVTTTLRVVPP